MKFNYLLLAFVLIAFTANAQFTFQDKNGVVYENGEVYTTNSLDFDESSLEYRLYNSTSSDIFVKAQLVSAAGNNGEDFEICFGLCYTGVGVGQFFPTNGTNIVPANGDSGPGNHMYHGSDTVDPSIVAEYEVLFFQTNDDGTIDLGNDFTIIYRYDPALGLDDNKLIDFEITSTLIRDYIEVTTLENVTVRISDKRGRKVKSKKIKTGTQRIPLTDLPSDVYFVTITNDRNISETVKVVKQ